jgi:hypothetical protein
MSEVDYIRQRRAYFAAKDLHSGWSGAESGPCCDACRLQPEHLTGRADFLKLAAGCRNPFQLPEVCQCHLPVREAVRAGVVEAHDQLIRRFAPRKGHQP